MAQDLTQTEFGVRVVDGPFIRDFPFGSTRPEESVLEGFRYHFPECTSVFIIQRTLKIQTSDWGLVT